MKTTISLVVFAISFASLPAFAQVTATPPTPPAPPFDHLCEDLGIGCQGAFREDSALLRLLATRDPREFLPDGLADRVLGCEAARRAGDAAAVENCRTHRPLSGILRTLVLVPRERVREADLPSSGARFVSDCSGRHLQVRADLAPAAELALLKRSFSELVDERFQRVVSRGLFGERGGPNDYVVTATTCGIGAPGPRRAPRPFISEWRAVGGQFGSWEVAMVPSGYVTQRCFTGAATAPIVAARTGGSPGDGGAYVGSGATYVTKPPVPAAQPWENDPNIQQLQRELDENCSDKHAPACQAVIENMQGAMAQYQPVGGGSGGEKQPGPASGDEDGDGDDGSAPAAGSPNPSHKGKG
jgi:hypothetical protein